ncbi:MAG: amylo-alpha-1,6-glucosidase [Actinobacteria bacterium]|nr:amylo-alpha-1,6-glucosidase [Actinomycetota bacterium]
MGQGSASGPYGQITCVAGDSFVISDATGDIRHGDQGLYVRDTRFLSRLAVTVDGARPRPLAGRATGASSAAFFGWLPYDPDATADPAVIVKRRRVIDGSLHEEIIVENSGRAETEVHVEVSCGTDFAYIFDVKHARELPLAEPNALPGGLRFERSGGPEIVEITATPEPVVTGDCLRFPLQLAPGASTRICLDVSVKDRYGTVTPGAGCEQLDRLRVATGSQRRTVHGPVVRCSDLRMARLVRRSLEDLTSLQLPDPDAPDDVFCAAGSPWFLTLFGRDSVWAAFMALPYHLGLAGGTLRVLARRQGRQVNLDTEEAPGKILHEVRRGSLSYRGPLPEVYYGTIDATPLWVVLLSEAWRWGLPEEEVGALLDNLEAALMWMRDYGDGDDDGFIEYVRHGDKGLANQGWKDSWDGVQFADGRIATAPISLVEAQAYAYDAAGRGAEILEHFGRPGADEWRQWAAELRERFHRRFWTSDELGSYLAIALDRHGDIVDAPASNMGHALGSGILDDDQAAQVAARLGHASCDSGWGLRTMAATAAGYNPLSYHGGCVWPHDTAIAAWGCARTGNDAVAGRLLRGLVRAAPFFDYRLPELFSGVPRTPAGFPVPYPTACQPQAWAAGAGLLLLRACLDAQPDIPNRRLTLRPLQPFPFRRLELRDIPLAGGHLDVVVEAGRGVDVDIRGTDVDVRLGSDVG